MGGTALSRSTAGAGVGDVGLPPAYSLPRSPCLNRLKEVIPGSLTFLQILIYTQE